jgi:hypothetical protein
MEKPPTPRCPLLPDPDPSMSYRDLREARETAPPEFHEAARKYAHFLWLKGKPARAILALCRALYLEPAELPAGTVAPYAPYAWMLERYHGRGFLGNPRISFFHQATRMNPQRELFRRRAWAMWWITTHLRPELPAEPGCEETPPATDWLADFLNRRGLPREGVQFQAALP